MGEYKTKTGRILTDADFEALADEAEAGYDVAALQLSPNLIRVLLRFPDGSELWAHLPQVPSRDEVVTIADRSYRVGGVDWRVARYVPTVPCSDRVALTVVRVLLFEIG